MEANYILALDLGTSHSKAIVYSYDGSVVASAERTLPHKNPKLGWVEVEPDTIWSTQASAIGEVVSKVGANGKNIKAIGITNQRETTILWERKTGDPVYNAIVWMDRRTADIAYDLKEQGYGPMIREKTGLIPDAYFSATKIKWILDNVKGAREKAESGKLAFGTVDSWLVWKLTKGKYHVTDVSNASRTMLFNIHTLMWDEELLRLFNIPNSILPDVTASSGILAEAQCSLFAHKIPVAGIAGDQQAALFGQLCVAAGMAKTTYSTGNFMLMNTGDQAVESNKNLLATIAWQIGERVTYALEGSIFVTGAAFQWLKDEMRLVKSVKQLEKLAYEVNDNGGVYFVPALTGLGAPHWDQYARGTLVGLTRGSNKRHIIRALIESVAHQTMDLLHTMEEEAGMPIRELRVDGAYAENNFLMQFQANILGLPVERPKETQITALGAAYLAGLATGFWEEMEQLENHWRHDAIFNPELDQQTVRLYRRKWAKALQKSKKWIDKYDV